MRYRALGNSGLRVSEVALGSWLTLGSRLEREASQRTVQHAIEHGINLLDTADVYAHGDAEVALGFALADIPRKDYVLASKCYFPNGDGPNDRGLSRKHVFESLHASLRRLQTDYLDLYQCHRYDEETPVEETIQAMDDLCRQGKLLYWGVSCWTSEQILRANEICERECWQKPISNQPPYNMLERGIESAVLPACRRAGLGLIVYSPLAQGVLTGKYEPGQEPPADSRAADDASNQFIGRYMGEELLAGIQSLGELARELDVPLATFALAWCLRLPEITSVIVGAKTTEQLDQNIAAAGLTVPEELLARAQSILERLPPVVRGERG